MFSQLASHVYTGMGSCPSALQIFPKIAVQYSGLTISVFSARPQTLF